MAFKINSSRLSKTFFLFILETEARSKLFQIKKLLSYSSHSRMREHKEVETFEIGSVRLLGACGYRGRWKFLWASSQLKIWWITYLVLFCFVLFLLLVFFNFYWIIDPLENQQNKTKSPQNKTPLDSLLSNSYILMNLLKTILLIYNVP